MPRVRTVIKASDIARFLGAPLHGKDVPLHGVTTINNLRKGTLGFVRKYDPSRTPAINKAKETLLICPADYAGQLRTPHILSKNAGVDFVRAVAAFFAPERSETTRQLATTS